MPARQSIFGSQSERVLFTAIKSQWTDRFALYPSLPFATLIDLGAMNLRRAEREFLLKTNVDYTLCYPARQTIAEHRVRWSLARFQSARSLCPNAQVP
jgi:hypothetical protein